MTSDTTSAAERAFAALTAEQRELLLRHVFDILEYDEDGHPYEWDSDTAQRLGDLFNNFGVYFTDPNDPQVSDFEDDEEPINLDTVATELAKLDIPAEVGQSGGGTATLYAGQPDHSDGYPHYPVAAGPGHFTGPGWTGSRSYREEFSLGLNDEGQADPYYPPPGATEADIARMIAHVLRGTPPLVGEGETRTVPPLDTEKQETQP